MNHCLLEFKLKNMSKKNKLLSCVVSVLPSISQAKFYCLAPIFYPVKYHLVYLLGMSSLYDLFTIILFYRHAMRCLADRFVTLFTCVTLDSEVLLFKLSLLDLDLDKCITLCNTCDSHQLCYRSSCQS